MDTKKPIGRIIADVYSNGERYLKVEPLNTKGISVGTTLLYADHLGPLTEAESSTRKVMVVYSWSANLQQGYGNVSCTVPCEMGEKDFRELESEIAKKFEYKTLVILNLITLEK